LTPAARVQAAIEILESLLTSALPADRALRQYFRNRRYAGSKDRAAVAAHVFAVYRRRAHHAFRMGSEEPRALMIASLLAEGEDVQALFSGLPHGPAPLSEGEVQALEIPPSGLPPLWVQAEFPPFLEEALQQRFGSRLLSEMAAMLQRAPIDLRVNTLKADRAMVAEALSAQGFAAEAVPYAATGLRIPPGASGLERTTLFGDGAFEFQDEAAQIACALTDVRPGMQVCDLAAGAGGKSLALAALMKNQGRIIASDIAASRLAQVAPRAARAGVSIIRTTLTPAGLFDRVLVDAPCSGSGTWRRQPDQKWRLTRARLTALERLQDELLDRGANLLAPGGRLIYATCSVLSCENEERIDAFRARNPHFTVISAASVWNQLPDHPPLTGIGEFFQASPYMTQTDGFFTAILTRG
jgi:16S rRNA (cytosine967-C5)-methyltransferase